jgi:hypothetical protein
MLRSIFVLHDCFCNKNTIPSSSTFGTDVGTIQTSSTTTKKCSFFGSKNDCICCCFVGCVRACVPTKITKWTPLMMCQLRIKSCVLLIQRNKDIFLFFFSRFCRPFRQWSDVNCFHTTLFFPFQSTVSIIYLHSILILLFSILNDSFHLISEIQIQHPKELLLSPPSKRNFRKKPCKLSWFSNEFGSLWA